MNFKKTWKRFWSLSRSSEGFTLVELIVVIAILAILAGIAVPAYSGYIKKANKAADLQLLGAVNTAFAAAVLENGKDVKDIPNGGVNPRWGATTDAGKTLIGVSGIYDTAFQRYYAGNTGSAFKQITQLMFINGAFVDPTTTTESVSSYTYTIGDEEVTIYLSDEDRTALQNSPWADNGLTDVDRATQIFANSGDPNLDLLLESEANQAIVGEYLGFPFGSEKYMALVTEKASTMPGGATPENCMAAQKEILANAAVLSATSNSNFNVNDFASVLGSDATAAKNSIKNNLINDPQTAMSQAAFTYAMYTSYASEKGITISEDLDVNEVIEMMAEPDFQSYISNSASDDIAAYISAMNVINSSAQNQAAVKDVLVNGFNNENMQSLLTQIMKPAEG